MPSETTKGDEVDIPRSEKSNEVSNEDNINVTHVLVPENGQDGEVKAETESSQENSSLKDAEKATVADAQHHFAMGKRHLYVNDITAAVNSLQQACRLYSELFGETGQECADVYFHYGKGLLELARIETGVLGNGLDREDDSTEGDDESNPDEGEQNQDEEEQSQDEEEQSQDGEEPNQDEEEQNQGEDEPDNAEEGDDDKEPEGEKTEEDDDIGNLQLAWEMLELSKVICFKQETRDDKMNLKLAEIYLKLGEVGLESENYSQSMDDLNSCLTIQTKLLKDDDRRLAETHYQIGVAHSFSDDFDKSIVCFSAAVKVIETRLDNLEYKIDTLKALSDTERAQREKEDQPMLHIQSEVDELVLLLPEIKEKLVDMNQMKKDSDEKLLKIKAATFAGFSGRSRETGQCSSSAFDSPVTESSNNAKPISNISHLVKKKRKPEEGTTVPEPKKAKEENGEIISLQQ